MSNEKYVTEQFTLEYLASDEFRARLPKALVWDDDESGAVERQLLSVHGDGSCVAVSTEYDLAEWTTEWKRYKPLPAPKKMRPATRDEWLHWVASEESSGWVARFRGEEAKPVCLIRFIRDIQFYTRSRTSTTGDYNWEPFMVEVSE